MPEPREISLDEVAQHNIEGDLWIVIDTYVYDISKFSKLHPGGLAVLLDPKIAGKDATNAFFSLHRTEILQRPAYKRLIIGKLPEKDPQFAPPPPDALSKVPYGEAMWLGEGFSSAYFDDGHRKFQKAVRGFMRTVVLPDAMACEENGKRASQEVLDALGEKNIIAMRFGPGPHLKGLKLMDGIITPEEFSFFHESILTYELGRLGTRGYFDGLLAGGVIGLPPVLNYANPRLKAEIVPEVLRGKKFICLAITEAFAGSDVAGLQTFAELTEDKKHWVISGTKKWITNGTYADYFTTACRTGPEGSGELTVILIPRGEGVGTKAIKTSYSATAGTAFVTFDKVRVPVENTLGEVGKGLKVILQNFNHERWMMNCISAGSMRLVVEECLKWSNQRQVFGKPLVSQPVIRHKLANMIARVEAVQAWLENITYQMTQMSHKEQSDKLAGQIALLKMFITRSGQQTAEDAAQVFGGRSLTQTGMGRVIENYRRTAAFDAILGGVEDVLGDLGVRQAMKKMPPTARL
ncbi:SubName: Full=Related to acyl-coa dehydrogenase, long-chain specific {ECO:0000313/EMBL:CCA75962.1} [Serendipita indica DSM 11827]|nr:SubName: Full=Related to acyl-coa dehydrogenase, long-chain specific {ECO:0000313/EMBL:CCA75962.1} [Serendipita indica DSM 11827]